MRSQQGLRPQDVLVLLKLAVSKGKEGRQVDLGKELGLSQFEVSMALERARRSGFIDPAKKRINRSALEEFVIHGLKYVYPAEPGAMCRGIATSHSAPPLSKQIVSNEDQYVWPHGDGDLRGQAIAPIYDSVPYAAKRDPALYELLALIDALRVGRAREKQIAIEELKRRLHES